MSRFNIRDSSGRWICPCCGFPGYSHAPAYSKDDRGLIGTAICPCCLWEPGYDDDPAASAGADPNTAISAHRGGWAATCQWQGKPDRRPPGFDGRAQLERLRDLASDLF